MLKWLYFFALPTIVGVIGYLFWNESIRYTLPAEKPTDFVALQIGTKINTPFPLDKPLFIHFHNMDCPCSRFNITELTDLVAQYNKEVNFAVVLITNGEKNSALRFKEKYDLQIPVLEDADGTLSYSLGVYATPQALIVNPTDTTLYYSGNYNLGRYCVSRNTRFAHMAIESLLSKKPAPLLPDIAYLPFGCELDKYQK